MCTDMDISTYLLTNHVRGRVRVKTDMSMFIVTMSTDHGDHEH